VCKLKGYRCLVFTPIYAVGVAKTDILSRVGLGTDNAVQTPGLSLRFRIVLVLTSPGLRSLKIRRQQFLRSLITRSPPCGISDSLCATISISQQCGLSYSRASSRCCSKRGNAEAEEVRLCKTGGRAQWKDAGEDGERNLDLNGSKQRSRSRPAKADTKVCPMRLKKLNALERICGSGSWQIPRSSPHCPAVSADWS